MARHARHHDNQDKNRPRELTAIPSSYHATYGWGSGGYGGAGWRNRILDDVMSSSATVDDLPSEARRRLSLEQILARPSVIDAAGQEIAGEPDMEALFAAILQGIVQPAAQAAELGWTLVHTSRVRARMRRRLREAGLAGDDDE